MNRRNTLVALFALGAATGSLVARAQQPERMRRIGILMSLAANDPVMHPEVKALEQGLQELGWADGRNMKLEYRWAAAKADLIQVFAKELVDRHLDVIVARTTPVTAALLRETRAIPIVFVQVSDQVGDGFVKSLAWPGGNATGFTNIESSMSGKWLELLKEIVPGIKRVAFIYNPATAPTGGSFFLRPFEAAAPSFRVEAIAAPVHDVAGIEATIGAVARQSGSGLIVSPGNFLLAHRNLVVELVARHRLPAIYPFTFWTDHGGLISYGTDTPDLFRRAASYIDRILRGAKPSDLPVQAPTKFELAINLKTAKALGLKIPKSILLRADRVIE